MLNVRGPKVGNHCYRSPPTDDGEVDFGDAGWPLLELHPACVHVLVRHLHLLYDEGGGVTV